MRSGTLRHSIAIQAKVHSTDDYGGPVEVWVTKNSVRASVQPLGGRELVNAQAVDAETTVKIGIRYLEGLTPANRITFNGKTYNIQSIIDPDMRHRRLIIMAGEGLNEG